MILQLFTAGMSGNAVKQIGREATSHQKLFDDLQDPEDLISNQTETLQKQLSIGLAPKSYRTEFLGTRASLDALTTLSDSSCLALVDGYPVAGDDLSLLSNDPKGLDNVHIVCSILSTPLTASPAPLTLQQLVAFDPSSILRMIVSASRQDPRFMTNILSYGQKNIISILGEHNVIRSLFKEDQQQLYRYLNSVLKSASTSSQMAQSSALTGVSKEIVSLSKREASDRTAKMLSSLISSYEDTISSHPLLTATGVDFKVLSAMVSETVADAIFLGPKQATEKAGYSYVAKQALRTVGVQAALEGYVSAEASASVIAILADLAALLLI